jgi:hypothetical protein
MSKQLLLNAEIEVWLAADQPFAVYTDQAHNTDDVEECVNEHFGKEVVFTSWRPFEKSDNGILPTPGILVSQVNVSVCKGFKLEPRKRA